MNHEIKIICRGGGDLATGILHRLVRAGFRVLILETDRPSSIRRQVCFSEAVYDGLAVVEGVCCRRIREISEAEQAFACREIPLLVDPAGEAIAAWKPDIVIDAIIAKKNLGTTKDMAPLVIGVGPGFTAGEDVHVVVETKRGHNLARIFTEGAAFPNTGIPGMIGGYSKERVIHSECAGIVRNVAAIGDVVEKGQEIARIHLLAEDGTETADYIPVKATLTGILRGLIRDGYRVTPHFKMADIDPRKEELKNCFTISDKSRSIGGSVLEVVCAYSNGERYWSE